MANVFDLWGKISIDTSGFTKALSIANRAITMSTRAIANFASSSVKTGMTFDKSMAQVAATLGKTVDEVQDLREFAQKMGSETAFSASQSADALNYMALAGYNAETSMKMLPNVLNLAAAGTMDLARASDMVTDTATAFGLTLKDGSVDIERTTQLVDEMAKAASTGNTSVSQLGDAFLVVGGLAQELNGGIVKLADGTTASVDGIQELEIALTGMANAGIKGSEAGTHMRNMLLKLSSPTDAGVKQMEALGVSVFNAEGKMRSLIDIFADMRVAMDGMDDAAKNTIKNNLDKNGFLFVESAMSVRELNETKDMAELMLMYVDDTIEEARDVLVFVKDLLLEEGKELVLLGDRNEVFSVEKVIPKELIAGVFERPFDMRAIMDRVGDFLIQQRIQQNKKMLLKISLLLFSK